VEGDLLGLRHALLAGLLAVCWFPPAADAQVSWNPRIGFDHCVRSSNPAALNYYEDLSGCPVDGKYWLLGTQAESEAAVSCDGAPNGQSMPINADGPVGLFFDIPTAIRLRVDQYNYRHPCVAGGQYTWVSVMDHVWSGGGPLPPADVLKMHIRAEYTEVIGDQGGVSRMGVSWYGWWAGRLMSVDIQLYTNPGWGDGHPDPNIVVLRDTPELLYISLAGDKLQPAYVLRNQVEGSVTIDFGAVITSLVARGYLPTPGHLSKPTRRLVIGVACGRICCCTSFRRFSREE
jgi:hypothetical protein